MAVHRRYLAPQVVRDMRRKMVFVSGPRQVGKTTLARSLPGAGVGYLNWDVAGDRERVQDLGRLELMMLRLPELVGSPLSVNNLREDLHVSHKTASGWLAILERLYAVFRLPPFSGARIRAVKKEQKHYHLDWTLVPEAGPRFENLVAAHLLKWVHFEQDARGRDVELRYFRDTD